MGTHQRTSIAIPDEEYEEFQQKLVEIGNILGTTGQSETIRALVKNFNNLYINALLYKKTKEFMSAYELLYKEKGGDVFGTESNEPGTF
ncbi:MAG: hypothetical protein AYK18_14920 [Theionarchaea archaeon DG-70]|nr:MAG: hypothetical protein AYK18_14920 [Theionarchaea archaeon DG-70]